MTPWRNSCGIQGMRLTHAARASRWGSCRAWHRAQQADPNSPQAIRAELEQLRQEYGSRLSRSKLGWTPLEAGKPHSCRNKPPTAPVPPGAEGAGGPTGALPVYGTTGCGREPAAKVFNPDMAVIGDFLGAAGTNEVQPIPLVRHASERSAARIRGGLPGRRRPVRARRLLHLVRRGRRRSSRKASSR